MSSLTKNQSQLRSLYEQLLDKYTADMKTYILDVVGRYWLSVLVDSPLSDDDDVESGSLTATLHNNNDSVTPEPFHLSSFPT